MRLRAHEHACSQVCRPTSMLVVEKACPSRSAPVGTLEEVSYFIFFLLCYFIFLTKVLGGLNNILSSLDLFLLLTLLSFYFFNVHFSFLFLLI
jgi:hypothetical protein